eukprot:CAMPEP_0197446506 /NCGR_PEP_ID=MMETSP1175-20131217/11437_1 /TAXON_ID=1003142 /ORGANISM="Triceratium dubium, Strain CCMP147" /LENGTH=216 /DNA_ID=CAMNT_0042977637 /DNA_START=70 /DNA_END=720 /DNA_ORIENTATION=+
MTVPTRLLVLAFVISCLALPALSFSTSFLEVGASRSRATRRSNSRRYASESSADDDVARQLAKAKDLLARAKAKLTDEETSVDISLTSSGGVIKEKEKVDVGSENDEDTSLPFFAQQNVENKREMVTKSKDQTTGLITVDGDKLAEISGDEEWEVRPLQEVFQTELTDEQAESYSLAKKQLADKDVAASIWNLRKQLQTEDFEKIFDKRNRFIGEE